MEDDIFNGRSASMVFNNLMDDEDL